jgi:chaperonin GroEL (HSP60 family)
LTALASKFIKSDRDHIANLVLESVSPYFTRNGKFTSFEINDIRIVKGIGGNITDSKIFNGVLLDKELLNDRMPKRIENASIALVNIPFKSETPKFEDKNNKIYINSIEEMKNLISKTNLLKKGKIDRLIRAGVNVVICQKEIDNFSQYYLTKNGIFAITEVKFTDLNKIEKITGAKVVATLEDFSEKYIGKSKYVEETKIGNERFIFIEAYEEPKSTSILVRGGGLVLLNEIDLALQNALKVVREAILTPMILPGGGACETECYMELNEWAKTIPSREQFAVQAFAQSLFDAITLNLVRNCGLNEIQIETELRYRHKSGKINEGINVINKQIENMFESNIVEPFSVKNQIIDSAKEAASMILRIDELISSTAKPLPTLEKPPHFK